MGKRAEISGHRFGRLIVEQAIGKDRQGNYIWSCLCDCGKKVDVIAISLLRGNSKSCGCLRLENYIKSITHHSNTKRGTSTTEYRSWSSMKDRCLNPKKETYHHYGGRGIKICDRWLNSFENFLEDMGKKPSPKHSLDRYPNKDGNYEKSNCRWATQKEQMGNLRTNVWIEYNGEKMIAKDFAAKVNIDARRIYENLKKGMSLDFIINKYKNRKTNELPKITT